MHSTAFRNFKGYGAQSVEHEWTGRESLLAFTGSRAPEDSSKASADGGAGESRPRGCTLPDYRDKGNPSLGLDSLWFVSQHRPHVVAAVSSTDRVIGGQSLGSVRRRPRTTLMRPVTSPIIGVRFRLQSKVPTALASHANAPARRACPDRRNLRETESLGICYTRLESIESTMRIYNLFISHSWRHGRQYYKLKSLLDQSGLRYRDYSVPRHDPIQGARSARKLRDAIRNQMQYASVVLILAGVYASHSEWIEIEINLAESSFSSRKPIIAIEPRGSKRTSVPVKQVADRVVRWSTKSIVGAIRDLA